MKSPHCSRIPQWPWSSITTLKWAEDLIQWFLCNTSQENTFGPSVVVLAFENTRGNKYGETGISERGREMSYWRMDLAQCSHNWPGSCQQTLFMEPATQACPGLTQKANLERVKTPGHKVSGLPPFTRISSVQQWLQICSTYQVHEVCRMAKHSRQGVFTSHSVAAQS